MLLKGNCLDLLKTLPDNSIDSVVTDPPYELAFMGKGWDASGIAYNTELWGEVLRVLKPGGHLLAFGGTRTYHRLAVAIEDAGFEIRDSIHWTYGSGFPKSLDISKAIDKGMGENRNRQLRFTEWMRSTGLTASKANAVLAETGAISANGTMAGHYFDRTQPAIATADLFDLLRPYLPEVPEEIERLVAERTGIEWKAYKNREVVGQKKSGIANKDEGPRHTIGASKAVEVDITAPSTPEAQKWSGWGTALKPSHEPIVVARKPTEGTVANNVLKYGTGALNIDETRVGYGAGEVDFDKVQRQQHADGSVEGAFGASALIGSEIPTYKPEGRWPANTILTHSPDCEQGCAPGCPVRELDGQSGVRPSTGTPTRPATAGTTNSGGFGGAIGKGFQGPLYYDTGGASRFFTQTTYTEADWPVFLYYAKASKRERNAGVPEGTPGHPTVKPVELMRHLIRLVTPPGGTVLDPFLGSGTTAVAAILERANWIGCEMTEDYWPIIEGRTKWAEEQVEGRLL